MNVMTRLAMSAEVFSEFHDAPSTGVEMPVMRLAISLAFISLEAVEARSSLSEVHDALSFEKFVQIRFPDPDRSSDFVVGDVPADEHLVDGASTDPKDITDLLRCQERVIARRARFRRGSLHIEGSRELAGGERRRQASSGDHILVPSHADVRAEFGHQVDTSDFVIAQFCSRELRFSPTQCRSSPDSDVLTGRAKPIKLDVCRVHTKQTG